MENTPHSPASSISLVGWKLALDRAPLFLSVILLFCLPFLTQLDGFNPLYPKQALTQIIVFLILCAWVLRGLLTGKTVWLKTTALWPLAALMGWILMTLPFSSCSAMGWLSLEDWICFPLWYLLLTLTCFEAWKAENLLIVFLTGSFATCGWAAAQALGISGVPWLGIVRSQFNGRVTAGLGNPDFLAGSMLMVWPLALALYLKAKRVTTRLLWSGLLLLSLLTLNWTGSKAGFLGLVLGALVYAFTYYGRGEWGQSLKKILLTASATIVLLVALSFFTPMAARLGQLSNPKNESVWFRAEVWKGVVGMIRAHPILGTGFGTFEAAYPEYRPAALMMRQTQRSYGVNHAHNWLLEWTAETGIVGLGLLLWFWWSVLAQWWRLFSANAIPRTLGAGVFAAMVGVGVDNLFDVNSYQPSTLVPLLLLASFPVALSQRFYHLEGFPIRRREIDLSAFKVYWLPAGFVIIGLSLPQIGVVFQRQKADVLLKKASDASKSGKWDEAIGLYGDVLAKNPGEFTANYFRGQSYFDRNREGDLEKALLDLEVVGRMSPDYFLLHFKKYEVLRGLKRDAEAKAELKRAVHLDPMLVFLLDDFKKARELVERGQYSQAFVIYQNLTFDYPACVPMLIAYANCFALTGDYPSAINLYRKVLDLDPGNEKASQNLGALRKALDESARNHSLRQNLLGSEMR